MINIKQSSKIEKIQVSVKSSPKYQVDLYRQEIKEYRKQIRRCKLHSRIAKLNAKLETA